MPIPPNVIQAPDPGPLRYGLFNVATGPLDMPNRVRQAGITYDPVGCGTSRAYPADCTGSPPTKTFDPNTGESTALPFVVYSTIVCGSAGYTSDYLEAKVRRKLLATEQAGVEEALWSGAVGTSGALANTPTFQGGGTTILTAAAGLHTAIGNLEDYAAANYGFEPVLHMETRLAERVGLGGAIRRDGNILRTPLGTPISFGGGYPGTSPAAAAPAAGHAWIYITGHVTLWRAPDVFVAPAREVFDRSLNQYKLIAEREWLVAVDCFTAAIDVDLTTGV